MRRLGGNGAAARLSRFLRQRGPQGWDERRASGLEDDMEAAVKDMAQERRVTQSLESVFRRKVRTDEELQAIYDLAKPLQGFDKYAEYTKRELCKVMQYERYDGVNSRVVFYEGDPPDGWYVVLSGKLIGKKLPPDTDVEELRSSGADVEELSTGVFSLGRGKAFGEGALQRSSASATPGLRAATIVADEPVELLKVGLEDYIKLLKIEEDKNIDSTVAFLKRMPLFADSEWTHSKLRDVAQTFTVAQYMPNKLIYQQNVTHGDAFYIVKSGTCRIVKELDIPYTERGGRTRSRKVFLHINTLEEGAHFGEYAIIEGCRRSSSVCSVSNVLLYVMPSAEFKKHIQDKTRQKLLDRIQTYPSEADIINSFKQQQAWSRYKRSLVSTTLAYGDKTTAAYRGSFRSDARAQLLMDYTKGSGGVKDVEAERRRASSSSAGSGAGPSSRGRRRGLGHRDGGAGPSGGVSSSGRVRGGRTIASIDSKLLREQSIIGGGTLRTGTVSSRRGSSYAPSSSSAKTKRKRVYDTWAR